jgi:DNA-3-methyladenine glycosylase
MKNRVDHLPREFYARSALAVARDCLGKLVVHERDGVSVVGRIVEEEGYVGVRDKACHGYGGRCSARNQSMFGPPGHAYVFLIYGLHLQLNLVCATPGDPSAVLLRAIEPVAGEQFMRERRRHPASRRLLTNGPGKLCEALGIERRHDGLDLCGGELYLADGPRPQIVRCPRIGVDYAGAWARKPYRFLDPTSPFISVRPPVGTTGR